MADGRKYQSTYIEDLEPQSDLPHDFHGQSDQHSSPVNEARALRVLEIMNDFRTLQLHISVQLQRPQARAPDSASLYDEGYVVIRHCNAESQAILATHFNPGSLGIQGGEVDESEVQKATLQR